MTILGISAYYHDSAAAILNGGEIVAAAQEERFTRKKHDSSFPAYAIQYCLKEAHVSFDGLDAVVFYDKPFLKFERILQTYYECAPRGLRSFTQSMPVWIKEKLLLKKVLFNEMRALGCTKKLNFLFSEHHLSHAASAYYASPYNDAAILTIDGVGEFATASIAHGQGSGIRVLRELCFPNSVGLLYSAFTSYCGFSVNSGEYKLMGLAPYGDISNSRVRRYEEIIRTKLVTIYDDGSIQIRREYFDFEVGSQMTNTRRWKKLFGIPPRLSESELSQEYCDLAFAIQGVIEDIILKMAAESKRLTQSNVLCFAGGVALNCVANSKILRSGLFEHIYIQPAAGDAGGALGAAFAVNHIFFNQPRKKITSYDMLSGAYLGPEYSECDILAMAHSFGATYERLNNDLLVKKVANFLADGMVVGWFQGRMEWGPRALGNRSILADARNKDMQKRLNLKIKFRESFRPFAPAVLYEDMNEYFEPNMDSPYMLFVADVSSARRNALPEGYSSFSPKEKLRYLRSDIPAVTHLDYSARVQTVHKETNERFWMLLKAFKELTGCATLVNTSFNVRDEPIVCTPQDAYLCFMRTDIDYVVMNNFIFSKREQLGVAQKAFGD